MKDFSEKLEEKIPGPRGRLVQLLGKSQKERGGLSHDETMNRNDNVALARVLSKQLNAIPESESGVLTLTAWEYADG